MTELSNDRAAEHVTRDCLSRFAYVTEAAAKAAARELGDDPRLVETAMHAYPCALAHGLGIPCHWHVGRAAASLPALERVAQTTRWLLQHGVPVGVRSQAKGRAYTLRRVSAQAEGSRPGRGGRGPRRVARRGSSRGR